MKTVHVFDIQSYHTALHPSADASGRYLSQQGAGFGNFAANVKRYSIPIIKRYILPHAKEAARNTYNDVMNGSSIRQAIEKNSIGFLHDATNDITNDIFEKMKQKGSGIRKRNISHLSARAVTKRLVDSPGKASQTVKKERTKLPAKNRNQKKTFFPKMALINSLSTPSIRGEADLFTVPSTDTTVENSLYVEYKPTVNIQDSDAKLEFKISGNSNQYLDLFDSFLYVRVKVVSEDGSNLDINDNISTANNFLHSLFQQCDQLITKWFLQQTTVTPINVT